MNWTKLFEAQDKLDKHIEKQKGLQGKDLLNKKILAFVAEFGELLNEWRGFKFWSEDQKANTEVMYCLNCEKAFEAKNYVCGCYGDYEVAPFTTINPLLEEYVDGLH